MEEYRTGYLCITLFSVLPLAYLCGHGLLTRKNIENGLLLIAVIQIVFITGQIIGLTDFGNTFFPVTGANENPTVTAIYLAGCMPLAVRRIMMKNHRSFYITLSVCLLASVAILKCRTAYIGLFVEGVVWAIMNVRRNPRSAIFKYRRTIIPLALVLVLFASIRLYDMKRDSAAGRLLIWKISAEMIVEKPQGYGYGLFEKHYNLRQANYFRSIQASAQERQRADFTPMAYNDYLEQGVEGGVAGILLLTAFYILLVVVALRRHDTQALCIVTAFAVMSLTNFIYSSIQPWWLLMCYAALLASTRQYAPTKRNVSVCTALPVLLLSLVALFRVMSLTKSQMALASCHGCVSGGRSVADKNLESLQPAIGTSEAYWTLRAYNHVMAKEYTDAAACLEQARQFTSSPKTLEMEYAVCTLSGKEGLGYVDTLYYMRPKMLRPKRILMEHADRQGNKRQALAYAQEILDTPVTVASEECSVIRKKAHQYVLSNQPQ